MTSRLIGPIPAFPSVNRYRDTAGSCDGHVGLRAAHWPAQPNSTEYGTIRKPAVITTATTTATTFSWRRRRRLVLAPDVANALQTPCRRCNPTAISAVV